MKAVVHIGLPKTGTTTIQNLLWDNADALEKQGILYRRYRTNEVFQSEYAAVAFRSTRRLHEDKLRQRRFGFATLEELDAHVARFEEWFDMQIQDTTCDTWLISSELLTAGLRKQPGIRAIQEWLASKFSKVTYIVYFRRQDQWLESQYSQSLRNGDIRTFDQYLAEREGRDYLEIFKLWSRVPGPENVRVRLMQPSSLKDGDLISDFCEMAGIDLSTIEPPRRRNESFSQRGAALVRWVNAAAAAFWPKHTAASRYTRKLGHMFATVALRGGNKIRMTPEQRDQTLAQFEQSNEMLRQLLFPNRDTLFDMSSAASTSPIIASKAVRGLS